MNVTALVGKRREEKEIVMMKYLGKWKEKPRHTNQDDDGGLMILQWSTTKEKQFHNLKYPGKKLNEGPFVQRTMPSYCSSLRWQH